MLGLSRHTCQGVLHVIFLQLGNRVGNHHDRTHQRVEKRHFVGFRVIFVVAVLIHNRVHSVERVLNVANCKITPVIGLCRGHRALEEHRGISVVLVEHHRGTLDRLVQSRSM